MASKLEKLMLAVGPDDREHVEELLDVVESVAVPTNATVYLLHVFPREEYHDLMDQLNLDQTSGNLTPDALAARHESVSTPASRFDDLGLNHEVRGIIGEPATEVVNAAEDIGIDILFIGGAERSPAGKALFGNHAQQILLKAPCPVTYIQRES